MSLQLAHFVDIRISAFAPLLGDRLMSVRGPAASYIYDVDLSPRGAEKPMPMPGEIARQMPR